MPSTLALRPGVDTLAVTVARSAAGPVPATSGPTTAAASEPRRTWLDKLDSWVWKRRQRHLDAWLARSADRADLETRLKHLERSTFNRFF